MHRIGRGGSWRKIVRCVGAVAVGLLLFSTGVPTAHAAAASGWNIVPGPDSGASGSHLLMGTTCTSTWNCWAVGGAFSGLGNNSQPDALVDRWNGSTWSTGPDAVPPGSRASLLWGVSCIGASDCWAVGAEAGAGTGPKAPLPLAEHWNGSTWSVVPTPDVHAYLFSVTCTGASNCWAVGSTLDGNKNLLTGIIIHWNGSRWSEVRRTSSGQPFDQFDSVTCSGPSDCWAVGFSGPDQIQYNLIPGVYPEVSGSEALVEHWNGSTWTISPLPPAATPLGQYLSAVNCTGSSNCWAVGATMDSEGLPSTTLVEHWNGSAWTTTPSPDPTTPEDLLTAVTCVAASDCWATGVADASLGQNNVDPSPFIESWNGVKWSVDPSPDVVALGYLGGVACLRNTGCVATGFAITNVGNNTTIHTLIEQLQVSPSGHQGLWMSGSDGKVFNLGNAAFFGSTGGVPLNKPIVGMAPTPDGGGYWLVACGRRGVLLRGRRVPRFDRWHAPQQAHRGHGPHPRRWRVLAGGVRTAGCSPSGTPGSTVRPVACPSTSPSWAWPPPRTVAGTGWWRADGGVFAFGDAGFHGSTGSIALNKPIVGMAATPDGGGYWLVASDGGVFAFGDAGFHGSVPGQGIVNPVPIAGIVGTASGLGYWMVGRDGALYSYGDAGFLGSLVGADLAAPVVGAATG